MGGLSTYEEVGSSEVALGVDADCRDVSTTIYTHVLNRGACGVRSPLDH